MKFLKKFKTDADYQTYKEGESYVTPNVSLVTENNGIHYHPYVPPVPITYYATDKLVETTATDSTAGLHINAFNSPMVSHEFADGVGTITFEEDITSIGNYAFYNCSGLTGITIPDSVTSIGERAFYYCLGLTGITIPDSVTSIGERAFRNCTRLTSLTIGSGVTSIGNYAFQNCKGLTGTLIIPDSVKSIGDYAFNECSGLTSLTIGSGVTSIGNSAFYQCSGLTGITIPDSVTTIGSSAFAYCSGLTEITCHAIVAPSIQSGTFQSVKSGGTLYVPAGASGYDAWMGTGDYYLGKYNWTIQEIS